MGALRQAYPHTVQTGITCDDCHRKSLRCQLREARILLVVAEDEGAGHDDPVAQKPLLAQTIDRSPGFLVSWFPGFLVSWFPGFLVSWFPGLSI
jgi:hypothetical protein